jgi:2-oxo-3-hexenedioate decarboxylase
MSDRTVPATAVQALATHLFDAASRRDLVEPLTDTYPDLTVDDAYRIQDALVALHVADEARIVGAKLGLTSRAKQVEMHVHEPIGGWLTDRMALAHGEDLVVASLGQPRVEPEIAFGLREGLSGLEVTGADVLRATDWVAPAIEVLDSRYRDYRFTLPDVVADEASAGRFVIGAPVSPVGLPLDLVGVVFEADGKVVSTAAGAAVLGHPAEAVAWWVRRIALAGRGLDAGAVVLSGALTGAIRVSPGMIIDVTVDRLGHVGLRCI